MYNLSKEQIESVENFIGKIGDSIVKSQYEKLLAEIKPTLRMIPEQMHTFVALANNLPKELQNFPQSFAHGVKNTEETEKREIAGGVKAKQQTDLTALADESIDGVKAKKSPENKEETLHKLNTLEGTTGGEPLSEKAKGGDAAALKSEKREAAAPKKSAAPAKEKVQPVREGAKLNPTKKATPTKAPAKVVAVKKGK